MSERGLGPHRANPLASYSLAPPVLALLAHFREFFLMFNTYNTAVWCVALCAQAMVAQQGVRHCRIVVDGIFRPR